MEIVGGSYRERCIYPLKDRIWGSGGRAAAAVGELSPGSSLHTYASRRWAADVRATMAAFRIWANVSEIEHDLLFQYYHPLQKDRTPTRLSTPYPSLDVKGDAVLAFGMIEGSAVVTAGRAVFDPQGPDLHAAALAPGSQVDELAYVVGDYLLGTDPRIDEREAASSLMYELGVSVVVARDRVGGARVYVGDGRAVRVPAYLSPTWSRIGVGDVFCAAFAHHWAERRVDPVTAADLAARSVAYFADGDRLPLPGPDGFDPGPGPMAGSPAGAVQITGPSATLAECWLLDEARDQLRQLGAAVFSPFHGEGDGGDVAALLAFVDGGDPATNVQVGRSRASDLPVVILSETTKPADLTMFEGSGCVIARDFATAVYRTYMAACGPARPSR